jgi:hypothetical protein
MRPVFSLLHSFRRSVLVALAAVAFLSAGLAHAQTTTFTGKVYSPLGPTPANPVAGTYYGDPIPNILVFIQDPNTPLPSFTQGVTLPTGSQTGCQAQPNLVPATVLGSALTDPTGTFSFNVAGVLPANLTVVIQAGKWRRQYHYPSSQFTLGTLNTLPPMTMPSKQGTDAAGTIADLPHIAVVTGSADAIECIFPQIGIDPTEVTDPTSTGSINFFYGNGEKISSSTPVESTLVTPNANGNTLLSNYDLVVFGCQGGTSDTIPVTKSQYLVPYTSDGGRIFLTHYEYIWLQDTQPFTAVANWKSVTLSASQENQSVGQLSTSYSGEPILDAWMNYIGALDVNASQGEFYLTNVRQDTTAVYAPAQIWATAPQINGTPSLQFSFDTPIGSSGTPSAVINFTNNTTTFLEGDPNDSITVNVTNNSTTPTTAGLTLTLSIPIGINPVSLVDSGGGAWACTLSTPTSTCTLPVPLAAAASDAVTLTFSIPSSVTLGLYSLVGGLTNGGLNQSTQCGRVLYNDYHVEEITVGTTWTASKCTAGLAKLTNAQKFLEYSLYNLSNFVAPANTDTIQIQQDSLITWNVPTPLYYGTYLAQIETATNNTPGTTTYAITPVNPNDPMDANTYTVKASFAPNDPVDYISSSLTKTITILPDPTISTITSLDTSIYYGQEIGYDNGVDAVLSTVVQPNLPNLTTTPAVTGGNFAVTIDGTAVCTGIEGQPINGGSRPGTCPDAGFLGWPAGPHTVELSYGGTTDFAASALIPPAIVMINPDPTTTTLASTGSGSGILGTNLTFTATVSDTYATATGIIGFYDSPTPVSGITTPTPSMVLLSAQPTTTGTASLSLASLLIGTHNIVACFAAPLDPAGYPNMAPSCTSSTPEIVLPIPTPPVGTAANLRSSANPSPAGSPVTFTATIQTTGAFTSTPAGAVTFFDGANPLGNGNLAADGTATYTTSSLTLGTHNITVVYAGNSSMATSTSAVLAEVIVQPLVTGGPDFLLLVNPTIVPVYVGSSALVTTQVVAIGNFSSTVALTCTGLPAQATCAFTQSNIPAGGGTTQLIVSSAAPHNCGQNDPYFSSLGGESVLGVFGLAALTLCFARRRRKLQMLALAAILMLLPSVLSGCGAGNCTDFGVKPGDYGFTITATPSNTGGTSITTKTQTMVMHVHL